MTPGRRLLRGLGIALAVVVGLLLLALAWLWNDRPDLAHWQSQRLPAAAPGDGVTATWLGVATVLFDDGETALLTDGFFSRPGPLALASGAGIAPDAARIERALALPGMERVVAVLPVHSHYDHAMDSAEVARRSGALLVGSESTAMIGRGGGLPESQIRVVRDGETLAFGAFRVTFLASRHVPQPPAAGISGEITAPLVPPAPATAWQQGTAWTLLIAHPLGRALVQGSAGYVEGALAGTPADVVLLGVGALSGQDDAYREAYFRNLVTLPGARVVLPIHWDDFTEARDGGPRAFPRLLDHADRTLEELEARARAADPPVALRWLPYGEPVALFAGSR